MAQASTNKDADEAVEEEGIKEFVLNILLLIQALHHEIGQCQTYQPA
jgi:hypothetical protein